MSGFIYLWRDRKRGMYYLGSHYGTPDDGYVCGSKRMRVAYAKRPEDFRRRIIQWVEGTHLDVKAVEQRWLNLMPRSHPRYYNLSRRAHGADPVLASKWMKGNKNGLGHTLTDAGRAAMTARFKGVPLSDAHREKLKEARQRRPPASQETRAKISAAHRGRKYPPEMGHKISAGKISSYATRRTELGYAADPELISKMVSARLAINERNMLNRMEWPQ